MSNTLQQTLERMEIEFRAGTTPGQTVGIQDIVDQISPVYTIAPESVLLDVGSGEGTALNQFKQITGVTRAVGVEMQKVYHDKAVVDYPDLELHNDLIENKLDLVAEANIIFTNNISIPDQMIWDIWDSIQPGTVLVYNRISLSVKLRRMGYTITKFKTEANGGDSEFHLITKQA